jgi:hypothetical protein
MKPTDLALPLVLIISGVGAARPQTLARNTAEQPQYTLTIVNKTATGKLGSEIRVAFVLRNESPQSLRVSVQAKALKDICTDYHIYIRDENGHLAPETKFGRRSRTGKDDPGETTVIVGGLGLRDLQPGGTQAYEVILNDLYDLRQPGKYTVQAQGLDDNGTLVKSNTITLTLTN